jgi:hypothetical protein
MRSVARLLAVGGCLIVAGCASGEDAVDYPDNDQVVSDLEKHIVASLGPDVTIDVTEIKVVSEWSKDDYAGYRLRFELEADADINKTLPTGEVFILKEDDDITGCEGTAVYDRAQTYDPWRLRGILLTKPLCKPLRQ